MNTENTFMLSLEALTLKKHLMAFTALAESVVRLRAAYDQFETGAQDLSLWMGIREEEEVVSRLLFYLFRIKLDATAGELKEVVVMTAAIIQDCPNVAMSECFSSLRQPSSADLL